MRARIRTAAVLAAATATVVLAVAGCGGDDEPTASPPTTETTHQGHTPTATPTTPTATPTPKPKPSVRTVTIVIRQGRPQGGIKTYTVKKGEKVALVVRSDAGESVHLHGYWLEKPIVAGSPTRIAFTAKTPGRFEIELHHPDAVLGTLQVEP